MRFSLRLFGVVAIILVGVTMSLNARPTLSQTVVVKDDSAFLQPGKTSYTTWQVTQRVKPAQQGQLADPYHLPPEAEPSSFTVERRIRQGLNGKPVVSSIHTRSNSGTLLSAATLENGVVKHYDRTSNIVGSSTISEGKQVLPQASQQRTYY